MSAIERSTTASILAASGAAGLLLGGRGEVLWAEDPAHLLSGLSRPELAGQLLADLFSVQGPESLWEQLTQALAGRKAAPVTVLPSARLLSGPPAILPSFSLRFVPPPLAGVGPPQVLVVLLPLELRRVATSHPSPPPVALVDRLPGADELDDAAAAYPLDWYRQLLDLMPDGVAVVNGEGRITYLNLCAANQFGYRVDELLGRWLVDLVAPEDRLHALPAVLRTGAQPEGAVTFRVLRADGTLAMAELRGQISLDEAGERSTIMTVRDVSHEAHLQERSRARNVAEAITTFAAGMAVELDALLDDIDEALAPLQAGGATAGSTPRPQLTDRTARQLARGREIAARLKTISGLQPHLDHHPLALNETVAEADRELRRNLGPSVLLRTALTSDDTVVLGSRERLERAVLQLSLNAQQAMPLGGHLLLRTDCVTVDDELLYGIAEARPGSFVMLTVQDDGVGIDPEILDRIFTPYFTTHSEARGSGLGLALVQAIVHEHRGFVSVESQPGRGTRFRVYLPLHQPAVPEPGSRLKAGLNRRRGSETLLLVDDREGIRSSLQPVLAHTGYRVLVANGPQEATDLLARYRELIDLALVDLAHPATDAPPLLQELRRHKPALKLIVTADEEERGELASEEEQALLVLARQPGVAQLHQAVRQLLDG